MSLIVARRVGNTIRIVSDTLLTRGGSLHPTLLDGALKSIVAVPNCCICFAGSVDRANLAIAPILARPIGTRREIVSHLHQWHAAHAADTAFIVAFADEPVSLCRLDNGSLDVDLDAAWIGDAGSFNSFQAHFNREAVDRKATMIEAMESVVANPGHPTVGDFVVAVASSPPPEGKFRYVQSMRGYGFREVANTTEPTSLLRSVGAEGGGYRHTTLVPDAGVGALGVYIHEPRLGICFYPAASWRPFVYRGVSLSEFTDRVAAQHKISIHGLHWPEHCAA